jgi:hypothetical protein
MDLLLPIGLGVKRCIILSERSYKLGKIDYAFKAKVLSEHQDVLKLQREFSRLGYLRCYSDVDIDEEYEEAIIDTVSSFVYDDASSLVWREAERINLAYYARVKRLKDRIADMLCEGTCYFLTLTFSDDVLENTSEATRRRYVTRFLKSLSDTYVANIDFGSQNGREHYHAVVLTDSPSMEGWDRLGFSNAKKIGSEEDFTPVAKYISKLTNHAVKATTKGTRAIYSN